MLTMQDCIELSGLSEEEILAIAEHEHIPEIAALELGSCLCGSSEGERTIERMIREDIAAARERGDRRHAASLRVVLRHFIAHTGAAR